MTTYTRKDFLKLMAASGVAIGTAGLPRIVPAAERIATRPIPSTGEALPIVGLGSVRTFEEPVSDNRAMARFAEVVNILFRRGGTMIDTSPMYGNAEKVIGHLMGLTGGHDKVFMATKVWTRGKQDGIEQMERSFRLLDVKPIDLMQVHNLVDWRTQLATITEWKKQGRFRYIGLTHYTESAFDDLIEIMRKHKVDFVQYPYSIARRDAEERLLPFCKDNGIATIAHRNYEAGRLFRGVRGKELPGWAKPFCDSWGQFFLKYVLSNEGQTCVIPATGKPRHMRDNAGAGTGRMPTASERKRMVQLWESL